jgi:KDO2-lipid IV(A) lauroyltransferase
MKSFIEKLKDFFEYTLFSIIQRLLLLLPYRFALLLGEIIGIIAFLLGVRKKVVCKNMRSALSKASISLIMSFYRNFGISLCETLRMDERTSTYIKVEGEEILRELQRGEGVILLSAHFGNWELLPIVLKRYFKRLYALVHRQHNPYIDKLIQRIREGVGVKILEKEKMRDAIRLLRSGASLIILADQHPGRVKKVVDFFGKKTAVSTAPIFLAKRASARVVPVFIHRIRRQYHKIKIYPPIEAREDGVQRYYVILESLVRDHPSQWLWAHRRWREDKREDR